MTANHYDILGVRPTASEAEIKAAFKTLAKKYHPDKNAGNPVAEEHFKKINTAYQILSDKNKKVRYDYILAYQAQKRSQAYTAAQSSNQTFGYKKPKAPNQNKTTSAPNKKHTKYAIIVIIAFILFSTGLFFFSRYMNKITAKDLVKEAAAYEKNLKILSAMESYSQAIEYDPSLLEPWRRRAWLRFHYLRDTNGAKSDFENAIKKSESDYELFFEYAKFNFKIKNYEKGLAMIQSAIEINPTFDSLYLYKGEVNNYKLKNYEEAITAYNKALELNKSMTDALFGRAIARQNIHQTEASLEDFNRLIQLEPENGAYYYYRSWSKRNLNDSLGACSDLNNAVDFGFTEAQQEKEALCH